MSGISHFLPLKFLKRPNFLLDFYKDTRSLAAREVFCASTLALPRRG